MKRFIEQYREIYNQPYTLVDPKYNSDALRPLPEAMEWMLELLETNLEPENDDEDNL